MKRIMVQYKVKADKVAENQRLVEAVFSSLEQASPPNFRYASFKKEDGVSFVHIVSIEDANGENPLAEMEAFDAFTDEIHERCEIPPEATSLEEVGSYQFFGE